MAYHESIAAKVRTLIADEAGLTEKKMFGGMAFLIGGNMACGVNKEDLIVRVDPGEHQAALAEPGVRPFDRHGRPMKGWLSVGPDGYADDRDLVRWVERGVTYARTLPAK
jgi:TfoX/Sxy family transcriptional regulator of competence genes